MKELTEEQYKALQPYEKHLESCYKHHELHNILSKEVIQIEIIYNQLGCRLDNRNCAHCILRMCEILGEKYFNFKDEQDRQLCNTTRTKERTNTRSKGSSNSTRHSNNKNDK